MRFPFLEECLSQQISLRARSQHQRRSQPPVRRLPQGSNPSLQSYQKTIVNSSTCFISLAEHRCIRLQIQSSRVRKACSSPQGHRTTNSQLATTLIPIAHPRCSSPRCLRCDRACSSTCKVDVLERGTVCNPKSCIAPKFLIRLRIGANGMLNSPLMLSIS